MATSPMAAYILSSPNTGRFGAMAKSFEQSYDAQVAKQVQRSKWLAEARERQDALRNDLIKQGYKYMLEQKKKMLVGQQMDVLDYKASSKMYSKWVKVFNKYEKDRKKGDIWSKDRLLREAIAGGVDVTVARAQAKDNPLLASIGQEMDRVMGELPDDEKVWSLDVSNLTGGSGAVDFSTAKGLAEQYGGLVQKPNIQNTYKRFIGHGTETTKSPYYQADLSPAQRKEIEAYNKFIGGVEPDPEGYSVKQLKSMIAKGIKFTKPPTVKTEGPKGTTLDDLFGTLDSGVVGEQKPSPEAGTKPAAGEYNKYGWWLK